ncbi:hypothetical protein RYX36_026323, partial [Vicia faba]
FHLSFILIMDRSPRFRSISVTIASLVFATAPVVFLNQVTAYESPANSSKSEYAVFSVSQYKYKA